MRPEEVDKILNKPVDPKFKLLRTSGVSVDRRLDALDYVSDTCVAGIRPPSVPSGKGPQACSGGLAVPGCALTSPNPDMLCT